MSDDILHRLDRIEEMLSGRLVPRPGYLTVRQAANFSGLSPRKISDLLARGKLSRHRIDRRVLISQQELDTLILSTGSRR